MLSNNPFKNYRNFYCSAKICLPDIRMFRFSYWKCINLYTTRFTEKIYLFAFFAVGLYSSYSDHYLKIYQKKPWSSQTEDIIWSKTSFFSPFYIQSFYFTCTKRNLWNKYSTNTLTVRLVACCTFSATASKHGTYSVQACLGGGGAFTSVSEQTDNEI